MSMKLSLTLQEQTLLRNEARGSAFLEKAMVCVLEDSRV